MTDTSPDLFTPNPAADIDTLAHLGPLRRLAGVWEGTRGMDVNPDAAGPRHHPFHERIELQPIDPQTSGPQLLYGLRYSARMVKPGEVATYHGQIGYWLWEPATGLVIHSFTIPRGQVVLAQGHAAPDAQSITVAAARGATEAGICSTAFLERYFRTDAFEMTVTFNPDGSWTYVQDTVMQIEGRAEPFHHTDENTLYLVEPPTPNPLAAAANAG